MKTMFRDWINKIMIIVVIKFKMLIYLIYMNSNERIKYACEILNEKVIYKEINIILLKNCLTFNRLNIITG